MFRNRFNDEFLTFNNIDCWNRRGFILSLCSWLFSNNFFSIMDSCLICIFQSYSSFGFVMLLSPTSIILSDFANYFFSVSIWYGFKVDNPYLTIIIHGAICTNFSKHNQFFETYILSTSVTNAPLFTTCDTFHQNILKSHIRCLAMSWSELLQFKEIAIILVRFPATSIFVMARPVPFHTTDLSVLLTKFTSLQYIVSTSIWTHSCCTFAAFASKRVARKGTTCKQHHISGAFLYMSLWWLLWIKCI